MDRVLAGRDAECAALGGALAAGPGRRPPVVLVAGEAGAGKTTLVEHVLARTGTPALTGRAAEWAGAAYDVLARALRPAIRDTPGPVLAQIIPERGLPPAEPDLAALAAEVASVLAGLADGGPLALFLDDLQWADQASLSLLPALADAAAGTPVTLIGCYRSDELPRDHRLRAVRAQLRRGRQLTEIDVGPLGDQDVSGMLTRLLGAEPEPSLAATVASRADGIPFAVEALATALRDGGRLAYRDGVAALAGADAALVPDGIREAVLLRSARLSGEERRLLETAAVAGQDFDIDPVLAAGGLPAWPDGFTAAGLLTEVRDGRAAFRHSLTQEAAYADIPWSRRRGLHRELARALADGGAPPALIAVHLLAARDFEPAREALVAAADALCAVHAYRDAAQALRTALEHWPAAGADEADGTDEARLAVLGPAGPVRRDVLGLRRGGEAAPRARRRARAPRRPGCRGGRAATAGHRARAARAVGTGADGPGGGGRGVLGRGPAGRGGGRPAGRGRSPARRGLLFGRPGNARGGPGRRRGRRAHRPAAARRWAARQLAVAAGPDAGGCRGGPGGAGPGPRGLAGRHRGGPAAAAGRLTGARR